jgi:hypothetical protein
MSEYTPERVKALLELQTLFDEGTESKNNYTIKANLEYLTRTGLDLQQENTQLKAQIKELQFKIISKDWALRYISNFDNWKKQNIQFEDASDFIRIANTALMNQYNDKATRLVEALGKIQAYGSIKGWLGKPSDLARIAQQAIKEWEDKP